MDIIISGSLSTKAHTFLLHNPEGNLEQWISDAASEGSLRIKNRFCYGGEVVQCNVWFEEMLVKGVTTRVRRATLALILPHVEDRYGARRQMH